MDPNVKAIINLLINSLGAASGALLAALTAAPDASAAMKSPVVWVGVAVAFFGALRATWNETPGKAE